MIRLLLPALLLSAAPALAQHAHHAMPMPAKAKPAAKAPPAEARRPAARPAPARRKPQAKPAATRKPPARRTPAKVNAPPRPLPRATDPHAGHAMPTPAADPHAGHAMPAPAADPHAGHATPAPAADPHAGHAMPAPAADPHAGHRNPAPAAGAHAGHGVADDPPRGPPPPAALEGPAHAADLAFDPAAMAASRAALRPSHGAIVTGKLLVDRLEARSVDGRDGYVWDADGWYGGDYDKLWLKSEGEGSFGSNPDQAELQALWSHAITRYFDLQAGVRYELGAGPDRGHLVLGVQGLAPYWFELDGALFLSTKGDLTGRLEAEIDQRLTRRLVLQPRIEIDLAAQDVPDRGIGAGLSSIEAGLRLRYEREPRFAPYLGIGYERRLGDTARFARAAGDEVGGWSGIAGVRFWF